MTTGPLVGDDVRILPVIDLLDGQVVRGIAGQRELYRPVQSQLAANAQPGTIAAAFVQHLGATQVYVADLDAIAGAEPAWSIYQEIASNGLQLWVDAGVNGPQRAKQLTEFQSAGTGFKKVILGLESITSESALADIYHVTGPERLVFSLDLKQGRPLTDVRNWGDFDPLHIARLAMRLGIQSIIVLDLAQVGRNAGTGTESFCRQLRAETPLVELTAGGGIRGAEDIQVLQAAGCNAVLVASALHDGRITSDQIREHGWTI